MRVDTISQDDETGHNMMTQCDECNIWHKMTQHNTRWWTHNRKDEYIQQIGVEDILDLLYSTFNCMPFNFVMTHYWYRWYRATECLAAIHGVFEIESIWIINNSIASPSHIFRDSDRKEYLPIETYPSIVSIAQMIRGTILKKTQPLQPFMALKRSQIVRRALPLTLCFLPPSLEWKGREKECEKGWSCHWPDWPFGSSNPPQE